MVANEMKKLSLCALRTLCSKDYYNEIANSKESRTFFQLLQVHCDVQGR